MSKGEKPIRNFQYLMNIGEDLLNEGSTLKVTAGGFSMFPFLQKGSVIYLKKQKSKDYKKGDIVVFKTMEKFIAHRLVKFRKEENKIMAICKGDSLLKFDEAFPLTKILGKVISVEQNNKMIDYTSDRIQKNAKIIASLSPYLIPFYWFGWLVFRIVRKIRFLFKTKVLFF